MAPPPSLSLNFADLFTAFRRHLLSSPSASHRLLSPAFRDISLPPFAAAASLQTDAVTAPPRSTPPLSLTPLLLLAAALSEITSAAADLPQNPASCRRNPPPLPFQSPLLASPDAPRFLAGSVQIATATHHDAAMIVDRPSRCAATIIAACTPSSASSKPPLFQPISRR